jgi:lantibiotic modifying enzyme
MAGDRGMSGGRHAFLEVADRIGRNLCRDAVWSGGRCNWLGWAVEQRRQFRVPVYRAQGASLHDGTAGIVLFLAELLRRTGDALVRRTLRGAVAQLSVAAETVPPFGFPCGQAGAVAALVNAAEVLDEPRWAERRHTLMAAAAEEAAPSNVAEGLAGTVLAMLALGEADSLDTACSLGERLLEALPRSADLPDIGYAHGASGIACALAELARATGKDVYRAAALEALGVERRQPQPSEANGWSSGAPAMALSRLLLRDLLPEEAAALTAEMEEALRDTQAMLSQPVGLGQGFSLAYGAAGLADVLLVAGRALGRADLRDAAEAVGRTGISLFHTQDMPWPCGVPVRGETPNLMLGLAGIGYFYLRLHAPAHVPSVLVVSPANFRRESRWPAVSLENSKQERRPPPLVVVGGSEGESHGRETDTIRNRTAGTPGGTA